VDLAPDSSGGPGRRIDIIETKEGEVFVSKDGEITGVSVTDVKPRLLAFPLRLGVGLSIGRRDSNPRFSPVVVFAPVEWAGWIHAPIASADLDGIGIGLQLQVYHDIFLGVTRVWHYEDGVSLKATIAFML